MLRIRGLMVFLTLVGLIATTTARAQIDLTGAILFSTDGTGGEAFGQIWNTRAGDGWFNLWVSDSGGAVNGPTDADAGIDLSLSPGLYTFALFGEPGGEVAENALNLFFNGDNTNPGISVRAPLLTGAGDPHVFSANSSSTTFDLSASMHVAGTGSLVYSSGGLVATLTDFYWAAPGVFSTDEGEANDRTPNGANDFVGGFTLRVTAVPELSSATLFLVGLLPLGGLLLHRRRR